MMKLTASLIVLSLVVAAATANFFDDELSPEHALTTQDFLEFLREQYFPMETEKRGGGTKRLGGQCTVYVFFLKSSYENK